MGETREGTWKSEEGKERVSEKKAGNAESEKNLVTKNLQRKGSVESKEHSSAAPPPHPSALFSL